ncbi:MAG: cation diffusion facilitator family transporter [Pirellulales bacterium]
MHDHSGHAHHGHSHGLPSGPARRQNRARLAWTLALTLAYMVAEIVGGYLSGSLALLADAGHMFSDAAALGLSLFAAWISARPPTPQHSYGYYRAEILAALANGATLVAIAIMIVVEAVSRLGTPHPVAGTLMMTVAAGGLVINFIGLAILHSGRSENLNVHGAWLHLLTDALGSVAALAAGALIWLGGWNWVDPVASILIALLVIYSSWSLLKQAIAILMESTPAHLDVDEVRNALAAAPGACEVHDLHIWTITSGMVSLSAHLVVTEGHDPATCLETLRKTLHERFGIDHSTIQIEPAGNDRCRTSF